MTDKELIARARLAQRDERMSTGALYGDLADRIEALGKAWTEWAEVSQSNYRRAKAAEAKLARAEWLLTDAAVQLEEGKIKTRRNRAGLIWQFLVEIKAT